MKKMFLMVLCAAAAVNVSFGAVTSECVNLCKKVKANVENDCIQTNNCQGQVSEIKQKECLSDCQFHAKKLFAICATKKCIKK